MGTCAICLPLYLGAASSHCSGTSTKLFSIEEFISIKGKHIVNLTKHNLEGKISISIHWSKQFQSKFFLQNNMRLFLLIKL